MQHTKAALGGLTSAFIWALLVAVASAADPTWVSQHDRFSVALPNASWTQTDVPNANAKWAAVNRAKGKSVVVEVFASQPGRDSISDGQGFEQGFLKAGHGRGIKSGTCVIDGRPAYRFVAETAIRGKTLSAVGVYVVTHGRAYAIGGNSTTGNADADPEINATINSFHLLDPPDAPPNADTSAQANPGAAERMGEAAFRIVAFGLAAILIGYFVLPKVVGR